MCCALTISFEVQMSFRLSPWNTNIIEVSHQNRLNYKKNRETREIQKHDAKRKTNYEFCLIERKKYRILSKKYHNISGTRRAPKNNQDNSSLLRADLEKYAKVRLYFMLFATRRWRRYHGVIRPRSCHPDHPVRWHVPSWHQHLLLSRNKDRRLLLSNICYWK